MVHVRMLLCILETLASQYMMNRMCSSDHLSQWATGLLSEMYTVVASNFLIPRSIAVQQNASQCHHPPRTDQESGTLVDVGIQTIPLDKIGLPKFVDTGVQVSLEHVPEPETDSVAVQVDNITGDCDKNHIEQLEPSEENHMEQLEPSEENHMEQPGEKFSLSKKREQSPPIDEDEQISKYQRV